MSIISELEVNEPESNYRTGWISIYRSIMQKSWYKKSEYVHLWIHILLSASHQESEFWFNGKTAKIKRGQLITGRKTLSVNSGISESKVERILKCFQNEHQIEQQTTNKNRLITVLNYDSYQISGQQIGQQVNNKRTTSEQQLDTYNNVNNINNAYSEADFLSNWKECRKHYLNQPTNILKLTTMERVSFNQLKSEYTKQDINEAMKTLFVQERIPIASMRLRPTHFLDKFETYHAAPGNKNIYKTA